MLEKPAYGTPCNGCGQCCRTQLCPLGAGMFGTWSGPCPALQKEGSSYRCGLVVTPEAFAPIRCAVHGAKALRDAAVFLTGADLGCDARLVGEPDAPATYRQAVTRRSTNSSRRKAEKALRLWIGTAA